MKRFAKINFLLSLAIITIFLSSCSEKVLVTNAIRWSEEGVKLDTALKSVNKATNLEKTKSWAKTYYAKGLVYAAINKSENENFKKLSDQPLIDAFDNYKKAFNMDEGKAIKSSVNAELFSITPKVNQVGIDAFKAGEYGEAFKYFEKTLEIKNMPMYNSEIDTAMIFNTAIAAYRNKDYPNAIIYFNKAKKYNYGEASTYIQLKNCYMENGDTLKGIETLQNGFETYPDNKNMLITLINYYLLESDDVNEAFKYLEVAKKADPSNAQYYSAEAHLHDKLGETEKAKDMYKKAIELNDSLFDAYYNIGVLIFNEAVALTDEANEIKDAKKYKEAKAFSDKTFEESLPYIEKAHELHPDDESILSTLKTLYYRLHMIDKYNEILKKMRY
ncbi:MAG: tetratricopeptide repeat protein [Bacteroidales bacterium]|jgi:tetratricopeptide (TPR) repeat protein|nr:tetratricopeptide repeat protein [Bacteroidales bacterium]